MGGRRTYCYRYVLSDHIGATDAQGNAYDNQDQNLYVNAISYNGVEGDGTPWEFPNNGSQNFNVPAGGQPGANISIGINNDNVAVTSDTLTAGQDTTGGQTA